MAHGVRDVAAQGIEVFQRRGRQLQLKRTDGARQIQIAVVQMGGIPGVSMTRTAAPQPTRKPTVASANGLGKRKA